MTTIASCLSTDSQKTFDDRSCRYVTKFVQLRIPDLLQSYLSLFFISYSLYAYNEDVLSRECCTYHGDSQTRSQPFLFVVTLPSPDQNRSHYQVADFIEPHGHVLIECSTCAI